MENENVENLENGKIESQDMAIVKSFGEMQKTQKTKQEIFTNITDRKKIFNLETNVDYKLIDCKGEMIRVKEVLLKRFEKKLQEPLINSLTGEIKETEIKLITILIDDNNKSYVTASKTFGIQMMRCLQVFGMEALEEGLEIKICEKPVKNSQNKALGFEVL